MLNGTDAANVVKWARGQATTVSGRKVAAAAVGPRVYIGLTRDQKKVAQRRAQALVRFLFCFSQFSSVDLF